MADESENVVLDFKMNGQVQFANTIKDINAIMNTASKQYRAQVSAMDENASSTEKLAAQQQKLQVQSEAAAKRTQILTEQLKAMQEKGQTSGSAFDKLVGKIADAQRVENNLKSALDGVNSQMSEQGTKANDAKDRINGLQKEENELDTKMKLATSSAKLENASLGENASAAEKTGAAQRQLGTQMDLAKQKVSNLEKQLQETKTAYGENSTEAMQMGAKLNDAKTSVANLDNQLEKLSQGGKEASTALDTISKNSAADVLQNVGNGFQSAGQAVQNFAGKTMEAWNETDSAIDNLTSKTGAVGGAADRLGESFEKVERSMAGSQMDSMDLSNTMAALRSEFGLSGTTLEHTTEQVAKFSAITGQSGTDAVNGLHDSMAKFNVSGKQTPAVLDALAKGAQTSGMQVGDLEKAVGDAYPVFSQLHVGLRQGIGIIASWAKGGVDATTALKGMSKASTVYAKENKTLGQGITETFNAIKNAKSPTEALNAGVEAFGTRAAPKMVAAIKDGKVNLNDLKKAAADSGGTVSSSFNQTLDPVDKAKQAQVEYKQEMAQVGTTIQSSLLPVIKSLLPVVKGIGDAFSKAPAPVKTLVVAIGAFVLVAGKLSPIITAIATVMATLGPAGAAAGAGATAAGTGAGAGAVGFTALSASLLPIIGVIAAVAAVIAGIILVIKNWGKIVDWLKGVWNGLGSFFSGLWNGIKNIFSTVVNAIGNFLKGAWDGIKNVTQTVWNSIKTFFSGVWTVMKQIVSSEINAIKSVVTGVWNGIKTVTSTVWNGIKSFFSGLWNGIKSVFSGAVNGIKGVVSNVWNGLKSTTSTVWNGIKSGLGNVWNGIKSTASNGGNAVKNGVSKAWSMTNKVNSTMWNSIKGGVSKAWDGIKSGTSNGTSAVKGFVSKGWSATQTENAKMWSNFKNSISNTWNSIKSGISGAVNAVRSTISGVWNAIKSATSNTWNGIKNAISGPMNAARNAVASVINGIKGLFNFHISWPHIPLPHFSISGDFNPLKGHIPHVAVDWYAQGGIMTNPTLMGYQGGRAQVGGEAGPEAVIPLNDETMQRLGKAIASNAGGGSPMILQIDGRTFAQIAGPYMADYVKQQDATTNFSYGRR